MGKKKVKKVGKVFSLAFFLGIPANFTLGAMGILTLIAAMASEGFQIERWLLFGFGLLSALVFLSGAKLSWIRVLVHECKHALLVLMVGNKMTEFEVASNSGHVSYEMPKENFHYVPLISLAPYCLPLFSFPIWLLCLLLGEEAREIFLLVLGLSLGADLVFGFSEIHPRQTDFQKISGGFFASALYIASVYFMWVSLALLWVQGGREIYLNLAYYLLDLGYRVFLA